MIQAMTDITQHVFVALCLFGFVGFRGVKQKLFAIVGISALINMALLPFFESMISYVDWSALTVSEKNQIRNSYIKVNIILASLDALVAYALIKWASNFAGFLISALCIFFIAIRVTSITYLYLSIEAYYPSVNPLLTTVKSIYSSRQDFILYLNAIEILVLLGGLIGWSRTRASQFFNFFSRSGGYAVRSGDSRYSIGPINTKSTESF